MEVRPDRQNETQFLPSSGRVDTAIWMHYLDANKTAGEKARLQLHKNAASNIEQVPEATPSKAQLYGHLPPITKTIKVRRTRHAGHCWRSRDELISDVLLLTPTYGRAKAGRPARTYIQQLCEDTGCSPENLPEAMNDREKWRERVRDICAGGTTRWWWLLIWIQGLKIQSALLFTHSLGDNRWVHAFSRWKANSFIHDLNSSHRFHWCSEATTICTVTTFLWRIATRRLHQNSLLRRCLRQLGINLNFALSSKKCSCRLEGRNTKAKFFKVCIFSALNKFLWVLCYLTWQR